MKSVRSISLKFWLPLLVCVTFILLWMFLIINEFRSLETELVKSSIRSVKQDMTALQREVEKEVRQNNATAARQALSLRGLDHHYQILVAIDQGSQILYSTRLALVNQPITQVSSEFNPDYFKQAIEKNLPQINFDELNHHITGYIPLKLSLQDNQIRSFASGALFFVYDLNQGHNQIWGRLWQTVLPAGLGLLFVMVLLIGFLHYFVTRPIRHLVSTAKAIAKGEPDVRCHISGRGEMSNLGIAFDAMAVQLKKRFEQRTLAEKALRRSENQKRDLLNNTTAVIYIKDCEGCYLFINQMYEKLFHISNEEIIGKTDFDLFPEDMAKAFRKNDLIAMTKPQPLETEETIIQDDGDHTYISIKFGLKDESGNVYATCGISTDITERVLAEGKVLQQAHYDTLTGLPNRFLALDRLAQMLTDATREKTSFAVLFIDLDDFKKVNDTLGHEVGDKLLIVAGQRLRESLREIDTVARLGGDEFVVLLGNISSASDSVSVIEKISNQFKRPFPIDNRELVITSSIGIAIYPHDASTSSELLRNADSAMYNAKELGRNTYSFFTESMNQQVSRRLELEEQLHGAMQRGEFEVVYQPQIDVDSGQTIGAEALLRWHSEVLGEISPVEFIPVAEHTGLIIRLGEFVLTEALETLSDWETQNNSSIRMAVNLSPIQFRDPELVNFIQSAILQNNIANENLELEITEGVLLSGHSSISDALNQLNNMGVQLAMDDFGTGYSSISYLRTYPFDVLKIDRSFINDITQDKAVFELVNATIVMAHALKLKVVAEGVETQQQLDCISELNCDIAQGYLLSKPISKKLFLKFKPVKTV